MNKLQTVNDFHIAKATRNAIINNVIIVPDLKDSYTIYVSFTQPARTA